MTLADMVQEVFAAEGMLARADTHFQPRDGQTRMAVAVARTMEQGGALVRPRLLAARWWWRLARVWARPLPTWCPPC